MCLQLYNYSIVKKFFLSVSLLLNYPAPVLAVLKYPVVFSFFLSLSLCFTVKSVRGQNWRQHHTFAKSGKEKIQCPSDSTPPAVSCREDEKQRNTVVLLSFVVSNTFLIDCLS